MHHADLGLECAGACPEFLLVRLQDQPLLLGRLPQELLVGLAALVFPVDVGLESSRDIVCLSDRVVQLLSSFVQGLDVGGVALQLRRHLLDLLPEHIQHIILGQGPRGRDFFRQELHLPVELQQLRVVPGRVLFGGQLALRLDLLGLCPRLLQVALGVCNSLLLLSPRGLRLLELPLQLGKLLLEDSVGAHITGSDCIRLEQVHLHLRGFDATAHGVEDCRQLPSRHHARRQCRRTPGGAARARDRIRRQVPRRGHAEQLQQP
mmetsp:Transcript_6163/g.15688  ORF Transcript_6163/g.15688 Transcript_6163/m.15688 type:complete len:263 (-) Transcript_6163:819-1607(-)